MKIQCRKNHSGTRHLTRHMGGWECDGCGAHYVNLVVEAKPGMATFAMEKGPSVTYPTYAVRNPWVDFAKEPMSKHFPVSHEGLESAITYCRDHKLSGVVYLKDKHSVEDVWENPGFNIASFTKTQVT